MGSVFAAVAIVTAYVPMAANPPWNKTINGTRCVGIPWQECPFPTGSAACNHYPRGTVLEFPAWVEDLGFRRVVTCLGGGGEDVGVDLSLVSADVVGDLARAAAWGRRRVEVQVTLPAGVLPVSTHTAPPRPHDRHAAHKRWLRVRSDVQ